MKPTEVNDRPQIELDRDYHDGHYCDTEGVFDTCYSVVVHCRTVDEAALIAEIVTDAYDD